MQKNPIFIGMVYFVCVCCIPIFILIPISIPIQIHTYLYPLPIPIPMSFTGILVFTACMQYLLVTFGGEFVQTAPLSCDQWGKCMALGMCMCMVRCVWCLFNDLTMCFSGYGYGYEFLYSDNVV
ncbi:hypothetical protein EON63_13345 [archaeon]|nr:MAG: hypothetical protein EON63_13345 [archaeon]